MLDDALTAGLSSKDAAKSLKAAFEVVRSVDDDGAVRATRADSWFTMVARTELQRAAVTGQMALYGSAGIEKVRWQAAEPCDECAEYDDQVFALDDVPEGGPPLHPNCAPAGTMIVTDRGLRAIETIEVGDRVLTHRQRFRSVRALSRTEFSGELVELRVDTNVLRVTGNHPIRTRDGWTPAAALEPGDEIAAVNAKAEVGAPLQAEQVPSECRKCGRLRFIGSDLLRRPAVPLASVDLNGKQPVRQRDIDAHLAEREVRDGMEAGVTQGVHDDLLVARLDPAFLDLRAQRELSRASLHATDGVVGSSGDRGATGGTDLLQSHYLSFGSAAPGEPESPKAASDSESARAGALTDRDLKDALAGDMPGMERPDLVVGVAAVGVDRPSHIAIVSLSAAGRMSFGGTVFNFAVADDESYIAEGIAVHNCRCVLVPDDDDLGDWRGSEDDRAAARRGNSPDDADDGEE